MDKILLCKECAQEKELQIKLEEERDMENFNEYVEAYIQLTPVDEQKGVRELHEDFNKQTSGFILHVYIEGGVGMALKMHQFLVLSFALGLEG